MHTTLSAVAALDTSQVKNLGLGTIFVVALVGLVIAYVVTKLVTKIIVVALVVVLCVVVYNQRAKVVDAIGKHATNCDITFFGIHVKPSDANIKAACAEIAKQQHR